MALRRVGLLLGALALSGGLAACSLTPATLAFESRTLTAGETDTVTLFAQGFKRLQGVQIGPKGAVRFDPAVIRVEAVSGANGFVVLSHEIDNDAGTVRLAAGTPVGAVSNGPLLVFTVTAVGAPGASTSLRLTQVDLLTDAEGNVLGRVKLAAGTVRVR